MKKVLDVEGMVCGNCEKHVEKALSELEGVTSVTADLQAKTAIVALSKIVDDNLLKEVVIDAGYEVTGIKNL